jgi:hypothetical protein
MLTHGYIFFETIIGPFGRAVVKNHKIIKAKPGFFLCSLVKNAYFI